MSSSTLRAAVPAALIYSAATVAAVLLSFAMGNFPVDDAFISYRYADNFARGLGLVYNTGERVEGYTNFLWVLLLAGARRAGFEIPDASRILGFLAALAALALTFRLGRELFPGRPVVIRLLPGLLLALNRSFWFWAVGGLETPLFTLLVLFGLLYHLRGEGPRDALISTLFLFAATLTRPEGGLVFGLLLLHGLLTGGQGRLRRSAPAAVLFTGLLAGYLAWKWLYFGALLPNTFYAKSVGESMLVRPGLRYVGGFIRDYGFGLGLFAAAAALLVAPAGVDRRRTGLLSALTLASLLYVGLVGGDIYYHYRFLMPMLPLFLLAALAGALGLSETVTNKKWRPEVAAVLLLLLLVQPAAVILGETRFRGILNHDRGSNLFREQVAAVLKQDQPPNTVLATIGAGILPYRTGFANVDLAGLTNREIGRSAVNREAPGALAHQKSSAGYVLAQRPDFVEFGKLLATLPALARRDGWPLDFARHGGVFYLGAIRYPSRIDLVRSEQFHRRYRLLAYPLDATTAFMTFRRFPEGAIPEWEALANLGWAWFSTGDRDRGLELLLQATRLAPDAALPRQRLQQAVSPPPR